MSDTVDDLSPKEQTLLKLGRDRVLAHQVIFHRRHKDETPDFHREMIADWHSRIPWLLHMGFRGSAKSTIGEEAILLRAAFREFKNGIIIGSSADRAAERLFAVRRMIEKNEILEELFGNLKGPTWADDKLILSNDVTIQALGRGQALRGTKDDEERPELLFFDDLETRESVRTPQARQETLSWFLNDLIPAMDPRGLIRGTATPLDVESLGEVLARDGSGFVVRRYPIEYLDEDGRRQATWPARFPLDWIDRRRGTAQRSGQMKEYNMEFMVRAETPELNPFKREQFRVDPVVRSWHAVYGALDPARTVHDTSAQTGFAAWSWIGPKLIVWDAWGKKLLPNEIIDAAFAEDDTYRFTLLGADQVGLNEFLLQPLRQEAAKNRRILPIQPLSPRQSKTDRIRALQPFFSAREVIFAKPLPELEGQLLSFPSGLRDIVDALAYALVMRPGAPIYEDFADQHVTDDSRLMSGARIWLAVNATPAMVTAVLLQMADGAVRIYADWIREGEPATVLPMIIQEANLVARRQYDVTLGPHHFERFNNFGVLQALRALKIQPSRGGRPEQGRPEIARLLTQARRGVPQITISTNARWTLNGFASGYARAVTGSGLLADFAEEGIYRTLMEGLESFAAILRLGSPEDEDDAINWATAADGRRYISARVQR